MQLITFKVGLKSKEFVVTVAKSPPGSMAEMLLQAQKYMNTENASAAIEQGDVRKDKGAFRKIEKGRREKEEIIRLVVIASK